MEHRIYFVFGDFFSCTGVGALTGLIVCNLIGSDWNMVSGMLLGMAAGMMIGMLSMLIFIPFFGAMEVMLPVMLAGMASGMCVGMISGMQGTGPGLASAIGAFAGVGAILFTYVFNARVRRGNLNGQ